jgi:serine/threonine-protein kinase RsbW
VSSHGGASVATIPNVQLSLSSKAENVLLVRQALSGLGETIGLDPIELNDVSTAVSEACNNVVLHAYNGEAGPLEVDISILPAALEVAVRDHGIGIRPSESDHEQFAGGIGIPVIRALAQEVHFDDLAGAGTEVRMRFDGVSAPTLGPAGEEDTPTPLPSTDSPIASADLLTFTVGPPPLARAVVPRVLCALAARAYFSTDRISDTQLLADAIVAQVHGSLSTSSLSVEVELQPRELKLRIGPLDLGRGEAVLQASTVDGMGPVLERLAYTHEIATLGGLETLNLHLSDAR